MSPNISFSCQNNDPKRITLLFSRGLLYFILYHSLLYLDVTVNSSKGLLNFAGYILIFSLGTEFIYIPHIPTPKVFETQHLMGVSCMGAHCQVPSHTFKKKLASLRIEPTTFIVLDAPTELM